MFDWNEWHDRFSSWVQGTVGSGDLPCPKLVKLRENSVRVDNFYLDVFGLRGETDFQDADFQVAFVDADVNHNIGFSGLGQMDEEILSLGVNAGVGEFHGFSLGKKISSSASRCLSIASCLGVSLRSCSRGWMLMRQPIQLR